MRLIVKKFVKMIKYMNSTNKKYLTLIVDDLKVVKWYMDASFAAYPGFKSHTRAIMTML